VPVPAAGACAGPRKARYKGGQPIAHANLQFIPIGARSKPSHVASGTTAGDGAFKLQTYFSETKSALEGARPGRYRVQVVVYPGDRDTPRVPDKYADPIETPLSAQVPEEGENNLILVVDSQ
jgi:hypothetical protein